MLGALSFACIWSEERRELAKVEAGVVVRIRVGLSAKLKWKVLAPNPLDQKGNHSHPPFWKRNVKMLIVCFELGLPAGPPGGLLRRAFGASGRLKKLMWAHNFTSYYLEFVRKITVFGEYNRQIWILREKSCENGFRPFWPIYNRHRLF